MKAVAPSPDDKQLRLARAVLRDRRLSKDEEIWFSALVRCLLDGKRLRSAERRLLEAKAEELELDPEAERWSSGEIPTGAPVETPAALRPENLPRRQPSRRPPGRDP